MRAFACFCLPLPAFAGVCLLLLPFACVYLRFLALACRCSARENLDGHACPPHPKDTWAPTCDFGREGHACPPRPKGTWAPTCDFGHGGHACPPRPKDTKGTWAPTCDFGLAGHLARVLSFKIGPKTMASILSTHMRKGGPLPSRPPLGR